MISYYLYSQTSIIRAFIPAIGSSTAWRITSNMKSSSTYPLNKQSTPSLVAYSRAISSRTPTSARMKVAISLQRSQKGLSDGRSQLESSSKRSAPHNDQVIEHAESDLATVATKAENARATLRQLQGWFVPASDHQRKIVDKLAAEAALACCQKEAAAAKLQDAKLQREAYHNQETAKLREQEN